MVVISVVLLLQIISDSVCRTEPKLLKSVIIKRIQISKNPESLQLLESGVQVTVTRDPEYNPQRGIQNPRLSWIRLLAWGGWGAKYENKTIHVKTVG